MRKPTRRLYKNLMVHIFLSLLIAFFWTASCNKPLENPFANRPNLEGFTSTGAVETYNRENLFDYMNGEAEVYLPFGFQRLYFQGYRNQRTGVSMIMEAYDMGTVKGAGDAFEKYAQRKGKKVRDLGESAWADKYTVIYRRNHYFFRISPDPAQSAKKEATGKDLLELSRAIDKVVNW